MNKSKKDKLKKTINTIEEKLGEHIFNQEYMNVTSKIANRIPKAIVNGKEYIDIGYAQFLSNLYINYLYKSLRNVRYTNLLILENRVVYNKFSYSNCLEMKVFCTKEDFEDGMNELERIGAIRIIDDKYSMVVGSYIINSKKSTIRGEVITVKKLMREMGEFMKVK